MHSEWENGRESSIGWGMEFETIDSDRGDPPEDLSLHFQGHVRFQRFVSPFGEHPAVFAAHFDAGARTRPHVHRSGQVLHIAAGRGIVADRAGRQVVLPGDVITVQPDEWHWHGGTPDSSMTHVAVQIAGDIDWDVDEGDWAEDY
jgi:quercetin dioxygenase-like cupin family protein